MGFNFKACGCKSIQEFVNKMMDSEQSQLQLFVNYIINSNLDDELQNLDFKRFCKVIQWTLHERNNYAKKQRIYI
jgi:hypothetical protein